MMPGGGELILIAFVILLLFGGKELPRVARTLGKWTSIFRRSMNEVRREINRIALEDELAEAKKSFGELNKDLREELHLDRKLYEPPESREAGASEKKKTVSRDNPYAKQSETSGMIKDSDAKPDQPATDTTPKQGETETDEPG